MQFYNFLGTCPQTLLSQSILWAPLLVFAWDPSKPLAGLTMGFGPSKLPTLLYSSGMTLVGQCYILQELLAIYV